MAATDQIPVEWCFVIFYETAIKLRRTNFYLTLKPIATNQMWFHQPFKLLWDFSVIAKACSHGSFFYIKKMRLPQINVTASLNSDRLAALNPSNLCDL